MAWAPEALPPALPLLPAISFAKKIDKGHGEMVY